LFFFILLSAKFWGLGHSSFLTFVVSDYVMQPFDLIFPMGLIAQM
jgi:hypothetical protein